MWNAYTKLLEKYIVYLFNIHIYFFYHTTNASNVVYVFMVINQFPLDIYLIIFVVTSPPSNFVLF